MVKAHLKAPRRATADGVSRAMLCDFAITHDNKAERIAAHLEGSDVAFLFD
jgi:hypothetical protein